MDVGNSGNVDNDLAMSVMVEKTIAIVSKSVFIFVSSDKFSKCHFLSVLPKVINDNQFIDLETEY